MKKATILFFFIIVAPFAFLHSQGFDTDDLVGVLVPLEFEDDFKIVSCKITSENGKQSHRNISGGIPFFQTIQMHG